jgi:hypothetical protein
LGSLTAQLKAERHRSNDSVWEQGFSDRPPVGAGPYLSLTGQELAPGLSALVAVAPPGLDPPPFSINAAEKRRRKKLMKSLSMQIQTRFIHK